jgi:hypothetical protein
VTELRKPSVREPVAHRATRGRPVLLATLGVPFDPDGLSFALDTAVESGRPLVIANVVRLEPLPMSVMLGFDRLETAELTDALLEPARLARSLGVEVERLRVRSPRPVSALVELVGEVRPGIVVFGPDREQLSRRLYRRAAGKLREQAPCLVWLAS